MAEVSATEAARSFSDLLDAVEHHGERFTIVRRGRVVAQLAPVSTGKGRDVKALLGRHSPDPAFARDVASVRELLEVEDRS
ncbi:MAG TPA: type II toxin-antitoxin system prevent-host-death family antitoxin [Acidimicrobiales bacterium]|nr:type II toxin-antitoxin system prevent-host-death family antitoxin [Acidimicrobiales bacterium]